MITKYNNINSIKKKEQGFFLSWRLGVLRPCLIWGSKNNNMLRFKATVTLLICHKENTSYKKKLKIIFAPSCKIEQARFNVFWTLYGRPQTLCAYSGLSLSEYFLMVMFLVITIYYYMDILFWGFWVSEKLYLSYSKNSLLQ